MLEFDETECRNLEFSRSREWLIFNGSGGYASSTVAGMNTRRYHGLLVAATTPPLGRLVLLSQLEDVIVVDGRQFHLSTNLYAGDVIHPAGYLNLTDFRLAPYPCFTYSHGDWELRKSVLMVYGENTTVIEYRFTSTVKDREARLEIRPLVAFRDYHGTTHENDAFDATVTQEEGRIAIRPYKDLPMCFIAHDPAEVDLEGLWYRNFEYSEERERGLDCHEDLFSPLSFKADLTSNSRFSLIASTERRSTADVPRYKSEEAKRSGLAHFNKWAKYGRSSLLSTLESAVEQFLVTRAPRHTVIADYRGFGGWGRDTMIALPGLLLATDRAELAFEILLQFAHFLDGGVLPDRLLDDVETPGYNTVDGTLWFFEAIRQYLCHQQDIEWHDRAKAAIKKSLYVSLKGIVEAHLSGTHYGTHVDQDGFLWAGIATTNLTWMDAKHVDCDITPRYGRPVEIQALWFNALRTLEDLARLFDDFENAVTYASLSQQLRSNFEKVFWNEDLGYLNDVVRESETDDSLRPNQVFAVSLHYNLLGGERARRVLSVIERELFGPCGLRALSEKSEHYRGECAGKIGSCDHAYRQRTTMPWLAGPFFSAKLKVSESYTDTLGEIESWLTGVTSHLEDAGIGQISHIFGRDCPQNSRGSIAQGWGISEILRLAKIVRNHPARRD